MIYQPKLNKDETGNGPFYVDHMVPPILTYLKDFLNLHTYVAPYCLNLLQQLQEEKSSLNNATSNDASFVFIEIFALNHPLFVNLLKKWTLKLLVPNSLNLVPTRLSYMWRPLSYKVASKIAARKC